MRYFLDPFGCVKNQVDAENMMSRLEKAGWKNAQADEADLIIVNSCGFIESAKQESINAVIGWRKLYPGKKILMAGCLAQRYAKELPEILKEADGFIGVENTELIVDAAKKVTGASGPRSCVKLSSGDRPLLSMPGSAYVKISEGCDNSCSYCAIPLIRGRLKSRTIPEILEECRALLARGVKELCVIGQDIGSFGRDAAVSLPELLSAISSLEGHFWVRLLYIHPDHFPYEILDLMEKDTRFLPYFDIPFQHASSGILSAMNRKGTAEKYLALIKTIRSRLPRSIIRSTFLLGFPGETEEDFAALLDFQENASLDWLGCFAYSREEGTAAWSMKNRVSKKTAEARKRIIEERQIGITEKNIDRFVNQNRHPDNTPDVLEILIEEQIAANNNEFGEKQNFALGRLYCHAPDIDGAAVIVCREKDRVSEKIGCLLPCEVTGRRSFDLEVKLL